MAAGGNFEKSLIYQSVTMFFGKRDIFNISSKKPLASRTETKYLARVVGRTVGFHWFAGAWS
ncbi:MAG: hypothetical protein OXE47_02400, partial [Gammaproteobacteria bacterium]|nr:hypothetical protein [Gammaproteobacteria bacterium]